MVTKSYYPPGIDVPENPGGPPITATSVETTEYVAPLKRIAWAAVFAGVVLAIVIQLLLNMLGTGIGASTALLFGAAAAGCGGVIGAPRTPAFAEVASTVGSHRTVPQPP